MTLSILIALYLTVMVWFMRNMFDILLSKEDEIVYRWMWILGYVMYAVLWPITVPILINRIRKKLNQKEDESLFALSFFRSKYTPYNRNIY